MTDTPLFHIFFLLDRSGSMASTASDVIGGFNSFLNTQQADGADALMTLIQFDEGYSHPILACAIQQRPARGRGSFLRRSKKSPGVPLRSMSFERCVPDLVMLARLMADLDMPMDEHECMIEAVDAVRHERRDSRVKGTWYFLRMGFISQVRLMSQWTNAASHRVTQCPGRLDRCPRRARRSTCSNRGGGSSVAYR